MAADDTETRTIALPAWLTGLAVLPDLEGATVERDEQRVLLELTRIAAHRSDRIAAPITAYLAGLALAGRPAAERARALARIVAALADE